jgi:hypothetical protein
MDATERTIVLQLTGLIHSEVASTPRCGTDDACARVVALRLIEGTAAVINVSLLRTLGADRSYAVHAAFSRGDSHWSTLAPHSVFEKARQKDELSTISVGSDVSILIPRFCEESYGPTIRELWCPWLDSLGALDKHPLMLTSSNDAPKPLAILKAQDSLRETLREVNESLYDLAEVSGFPLAFSLDLHRWEAGSDGQARRVAAPAFKSDSSFPFRLRYCLPSSVVLRIAEHLADSGDEHLNYIEKSLGDGVVTSDGFTSVIHSSVVRRIASLVFVGQDKANYWNYEKDEQLDRAEQSLWKFLAKTHPTPPFAVFSMPLRRLHRVLGVLYVLLPNRPTCQQLLTLYGLHFKAQVVFRALLDDRYIIDVARMIARSFFEDRPSSVNEDLHALHEVFERTGSAPSINEAKGVEQSILAELQRSEKHSVLPRDSEPSVSAWPPELREMLSKWTLIAADSRQDRHLLVATLKRFFSRASASNDSQKRLVYDAIREKVKALSKQILDSSQDARQLLNQLDADVPDRLKNFLSAGRTWWPKADGHKKDTPLEVCTHAFGTLEDSAYQVAGALLHAFEGDVVMEGISKSVVSERWLTIRPKLPLTWEAAALTLPAKADDVKKWAALFHNAKWALYRPTKIDAITGPLLELLCFDNQRSKGPTFTGDPFEAVLTEADNENRKWEEVAGAVFYMSADERIQSIACIADEQTPFLRFQLRPRPGTVSDVQAFVASAKSKGGSSTGAWLRPATWREISFSEWQQLDAPFVFRGGTVALTHDCIEVSWNAALTRRELEI